MQSQGDANAACAALAQGVGSMSQVPEGLLADRKSQPAERDAGRVGALLRVGFGVVLWL